MQICDKITVNFFLFDTNLSYLRKYQNWSIINNFKGFISIFSIKNADIFSFTVILFQKKKKNLFFY